MKGRTIGMRARCALAALFAVQMLMHLNCDNLLLDDWTFFGVLETGQSIPAFLAERWQTWSSRLLIEGTLCLTTRSIWAWRLLDSAAMTLAAYALCRLANAERRWEMLSLSGLLVTAIPFSLLRSTGWQATSVNYCWPLACALTALIPLADALNGRRTGRFLSLAAPLLALFAANQEQTAAALFAAYAVLGGGLLLRERRIRPALAAALAVVTVELAAHLLCPGNALRAARSAAQVNLRDYAQFSLIDKLSVGWTGTASLLLFSDNPMLTAFCACAFCSALARRRHPAAAAVCLSPLAMAALCRLAWRMGPQGPLSALASYGAFVLQLGPEGLAVPGRMAAMFALVTTLGLSALSLYLSLGHRPAAACAAFAFAVGFASRMAVSLSPTVVESGERTMLPLYGAMMLCALLCLRDCKEEGDRRPFVLTAYGVAALLAAMNFALSFSLAA